MPDAQEGFCGGLLAFVQRDMAEVNLLLERGDLGTTVRAYFEGRRVSLVWIEERLLPHNADSEAADA